MGYLSNLNLLDSKNSIILINAIFFPVLFWAFYIAFITYLGLGDSKSRSTAEFNDTLYQLHQSIIDVVITKFHTVFLTEQGKVFTCGHGPGGRLGHGNEETILQPKRVEALSCYHCVSVAASNHHTLVLTEMGEVFTFGLNDFNQLGHLPSPISGSSTPTPTQIHNKNLKCKKVWVPKFVL